MRYIDEFRDPQKAQGLLDKIHRETRADRSYRVMEFCGGHTHVIARYGLKGLLPENITLIHGPGCPVCVLPSARIQMALDLARTREVRLAIYGDCLRVPGSRGQTLESAKAAGADIDIIQSPRQILQWARQPSKKPIIFLAIGFETTTPASAHLAEALLSEGHEHVSLLVNHVLTPPAIECLLDDPLTQLDGLIGPAHVSVVIGLRDYETLVARFSIPVVVAGFEPLDLLQALLMLIRQINRNAHCLENEFTRAVAPAGNRLARSAIERVFELREDFEWRGLGRIPRSALRLKQNFSVLDAELRYGLMEHPATDHRACECASILRGQKAPEDCRVFGTACTPETPLGACMVSSEGACAAHFRYERKSLRA